MSGWETHMVKERKAAGGHVHSLERIPEDESIGSIGSFGGKRKNGAKGGEFTFFFSI